MTRYYNSAFLCSEGPNAVLGGGYSQHKDIIRCLSTALESNEFFLEYQPKVSKEGRVLSLEALLRWRSKELGLISPGVFIPIAEELGTITNLTYSALIRVCKELKYWNQTYTSDRVIPIALNISTLDVEQQDFAQQLITIVRRFDVSPKHIILELTESLATKDIRSAVDNVSTLKEYGFKVSLDDFGTGHSGLSKLLQFEVDEVKVDRKFVSNIDKNIKKQKLCSAILTTCKSLNLSAVVEGVENKKQFDILVDIGFDAFQGFGFARPLSRQVMETVYRENKEYFFTPQLLSKEDVTCPDKLEKIYLSRF